MNDSGNYGFLTRDGFIFDSNTKLNNGINEESSEDLEKITRSESTNDDSVFVSREPIKNSEQTLKSKEKEIRRNNPDIAYTKGIAVLVAKTWWEAQQGVDKWVDKPRNLWK